MESSSKTIIPLSLIENILSKLHLRFRLTLTILAFFAGPLGNFLYNYAVSKDAINSFFTTFITLEPGAALASASSGVTINWYSLFANLLWYSFLFYVAFFPLYVRNQLKKSLQELADLAPKGIEDVMENFQSIKKILPQLIITLVFLFVYSTAVPGLLSKGELNSISTSIYVLRSLIRSVLFGSALWMFGASLYGLYQFGKKDLKLKPYTEDSLLGTRRIGALSFSLTFAYFLGVMFFLGQMIIGSMVSGDILLVNVFAIVFLIPIGLLLFLAPLLSTHSRMAEIKTREMASIGQIISNLYDNCTNQGSKNDGDVIKLLMLENTEKKVTSLRTWPVDNPIFEKMTIITLSVTASLIARLIQITFKI